MAQRHVGADRVILWFTDEPVKVIGDCDDGWVWGRYHDRKGRPKYAWFWMMQLHTTPWGA